MTDDDKKFPFLGGDKVRTERRIVDRVVRIDSFTGDEIVELKERFETALGVVEWVPTIRKTHDIVAGCVIPNPGDNISTWKFTHITRIHD